MKLFIMQDGILRLNNVEVLLIREFEALVLRDNSVGKTAAFNEFRFIYHIVDPLSKPNQDGYNEKKAIEFAIRDCRFKPDYQPDDLVKKALLKYAELRSTLIVEVCEELLISVKTTPDVLKKIRKRIDTLLEIEDLTLDQIRELLNLQKQIVDIASDVPNIVKRIAEAQKEINNIDVELARGKVPISSSMKPGDALG